MQVYFVVVVAVAEDVCVCLLLACYGIVTVPVGSWYCRKCESQERAARVVCSTDHYIPHCCIISICGV